MKYYRLSLVFLCCILCSFAFLGCSSKKLKGLVPVEGNVSFAGKPLVNASIIFAPVKTGEDEHSVQAKIRSAQAKTDKNGHFVLMTIEPGDGAFPGEYKVAVQKITEVKQVKEGLSDMEAAIESSKQKEKVRSLLPRKYASTFTSGLTASVPKKGTKELKFDL